LFLVVVLGFKFKASCLLGLTPSPFHFS
jgi:hypothetical protein